MRLLCRYLAFTIAALLLTPPAAQGAPSVTEFTAGLRTASAPTGIAAGSDGAIWFTEHAAPGGIGRISLSGQVTRFTDGLSTDSPPFQIAAGPDGNLWFTENAHKGRIGRITPQGVIREWGRGDDTLPSGITAGPDGNVWFAEPGKDGRIGRITPDGKLKDFTGGLTKRSAPTGITAGPDGNLWFTESVDPGRIGRITPAGVITEFPLPGAGTPREITSGPDGNLWFTVGGEPGQVGRITPSGDVTLFSGLGAGADPAGIVAGGDGALYVAQRGRPAVARVTTAGQITELGGLSPGTTPTGIAAGPDGALWITQSADPGSIARMTLPPAVVGPTAGSVHSTAAVLGATVTAQSQATTFRVEYGLTPLYGSATTDVAVGNGAAAQAVSATVTGLSPSTAYHFRVVATNASGTTYGPDSTFATTAAGAPSATAEPATALTPTSALLHGLVDAQSAATTYRFEWGTSTIYDSPLPAPAPTVEVRSGDQPVSLALGGLWPNTTYHFRVVATNVTGTTSSEDRAFTTPPALPVVHAEPAADVMTGGATLAGTVNPGNASTVWYVEWGPTSAYGSVASVEADTLAAGLDDGAVSVTLTDLAADTTYHYRIVAVNAAGVSEGTDRTFRTAAAPADEPEPRPAPSSDAAPPVVVPTPEAPQAPAPRARLAKTVVVAPVSGTVRFRVPGSSRSVTLRDARSIPVGAVIDAGAGKLSLTSALDARGATQTGTFWGGAFRVRQDRGGRGMTEIALVGGRPTGCGGARAAAVTKKRKRPRGVWGSDRHGRFRTRGSNSVATVRGTRWFVEERCDGTFTRVTSGSVVVRDLGKRRDVVVRAGRSYLARPRASRR